jgi:hypothetical protein
MRLDFGSRVVQGFFSNPPSPYSCGAHTASYSVSTGNSTAGAEASGCVNNGWNFTCSHHTRYNGVVFWHKDNFKLLQNCLDGSYSPTDLLNCLQHSA